MKYSCGNYEVTNGQRRVARTHSVFTELQIQLVDAEAGQPLHYGRQKFLLAANLRERNYFISFQRGVTSDGQQEEIKIKTNFWWCCWRRERSEG
jgi:hypothetical protein